MDNVLINGYDCISKEYIEETKSTAYIFKHLTTGLKLVYFENDDEEYFFSFCFPTLPFDNKGKPHIVEHCTLSGSSLYPYKDPFKELDGKSVSTFMNAMTFHDATIYPASSKIFNDFKQLFEVYADAVFSPLLTRECFDKEGVRRIKNKNGRVELNGVVLSEMLSSSFDKDTIGYRTMMRTIFNGTPYMYDSGGIPRDIALLTYDEFKQFYEEHYSLSKCTLVLSGKRDVLKVLDVIESRYSKNQNEYKKVVKTTYNAPKDVESLDFYKKPVDVITKYEMENSSSKPSVVLHYLSDINKDNRKAFWLLTILEDAILGSVMSPLSKLLSDSKRGGDISTLSGCGSTGPFYTFSLGLDDFKNIDSIDDEKDEIKKFFEDSIKKIIETGIDKDFIETSIKYYEFIIREDASSYPRALSWTKRLIPAIVSGNDDMFIHLRSLSYINEIKEDYKLNPDLFKDFFKKHFIDVDKKTLIVAMPSKIKEEERKLRDNNALLAYKKDKELSHSLYLNDKIKKIAITNKITKEDLYDLFECENLSKEVIDGTIYVFNKLKTSGISYVNILFDVSDLNKKELQNLKMLSTYYSHVGVGNMNAVDFTKKILRTCTGLSFAVRPIEEKFDNNKVKVFFVIKAKVLDEDLKEYLSLISQMLKNADYNNISAIEETLVDIKGTSLSYLNDSPGSMFINSALSPLSIKNKILSCTSGLEYINYVYNIKGEHFEDIRKSFNSFKQTIFSKNRMTIFITSDKKQDVGTFINSIDNNGGSIENTYINSVSKVKDTNFYAYPFETSYNAILLKVPSLNSTYTVLSDYLDSFVIWELIRSQGGAYGCGTMYLDSGSFLLYALQDPHIKSTYKRLNKVLQTPLTQENVKESIIQSLSSLALQKKPPEKNDISLSRYISKITDDERRKSIVQIMNTTIDDVYSSLDTLRAQKQIITTLSDKEKIETSLGVHQNEIIDIL